MNFDYFSCIQHSVIVDEQNSSEHSACDKLGEFFKIKVRKPKLSPGIISKKLVNIELEKQMVIKTKARNEREKYKKHLAQERFALQIPNGDIIINLLEMKI